MMERPANASLRPGARITGVVYLLYFLTAISAEVFVGQTRLVAYDAVNLIAYAFYIAVTLLFYYMFKPVNRSLSLLAAFFSLAGCANEVLGLFNLAPYKISSLVFFGPYCLLIGYLIFRSTFLPRFLGVLMAFAGLGWLVFLSPLANSSVHLSEGPRLPRGSIADAMAHRDGRERSTMEGAGQRSMKVSVELPERCRDLREVKV